MIIRTELREEQGKQIHTRYHKQIDVRWNKCHYRSMMSSEVSISGVRSFAARGATRPALCDRGGAAAAAGRAGEPAPAAAGGALHAGHRWNRNPRPRPQKCRKLVCLTYFSQHFICLNWLSGALVGDGGSDFIGQQASPAPRPGASRSSRSPERQLLASKNRQQHMLLLY